MILSVGWILTRIAGMRAQHGIVGLIQEARRCCSHADPTRVDGLGPGPKTQRQGLDDMCMR